MNNKIKLTPEEIKKLKKDRENKINCQELIKK